MRSTSVSRSRRQFLGEALSTGTLALSGSLGFLSQLRPVSADEARLPPNLIRADTGVEPTVRMLEETPREKLLEEVAARIKSGLSYRELLAGLLLAGVRNVQPRPAVGFKFHAVLVINSAHLASQASPDSDRWLPIFWALDRFKSAQADTKKESGWRMGAVDESKVPSAEKAVEAFKNAMDHWDEAAADAAAAGLARTTGRNACFELFSRYGARDFRDIGHKAIYVANAFRTLESVGWHHAEPVLRSLAYALMKNDGKNPAENDLAPDRPWRRNAELVKSVKPGWQIGKTGPEAAAELISGLRTASDQAAAEAVRDALNSGVPAQVVWDAILSSAAELLMRRKGIVALHAVTSANALHFAYDASADDNTRLMMLLQAASFVTLFRDAAKAQDGPKEIQVDRFEPALGDGEDKKMTLDEVFDEASRDRKKAVQKALTYLDRAGRAEDLIDAARRLVFLKGNDAHDYKYSSAVLEDYAHVSPKWRNRFLAASLFYLPGSGAKDNELVKRTRAALGAA